VRAFQATRKALGLEPARGLHVSTYIEIPMSRGLGSSSTAVVAGVMAANSLAPEPRDEQFMAEVAVQVEGHPDNVLPCLLGGVCSAAMPEGDRRLTYVSLEPKHPPAIAIAIPEDLQLDTAEMRAILPAQVSFQDAVFNVSRVALFVLALTQGRHDVLAAALDDRLHQPYRGAKIPGWSAVRRAARESGALGTVISGSGPTLLSFAPTPETASAVAESMEAEWAKHGVPSVASVIGLTAAGARIHYGSQRLPRLR